MALGAMAGTALVMMAGVMAVLWLLQRRTGNAGVVDVGWAAGVGACGVLFAALASGDAARRAVAAALVAGWSFRLAASILRRVLREREDGRYARLRRQWGERFQARLFVFYEVQAVAAAAFAVPVLAAAADPRPLGWPQGAAAVALWLVAVAGESIADRQLARFRADPSNRGRTCRTGLWRVSRHPNYFFEWLHWWSYVALAAGGPWWGVTLAGPALMLAFLVAVTGIPVTEAHAAASRPDYRDYQRTTSAFIPWFPRRKG